MAESIHVESNYHLAGIVALGQANVRRAKAETQAALSGLSAIDSLTRKVQEMAQTIRLIECDLKDSQARNVVLTKQVERLAQRVDYLEVQLINSRPYRSNLN